MECVISKEAVNTLTGRLQGHLDDSLSSWVRSALQHFCCQKHPGSNTLHYLHWNKMMRKESFGTTERCCSAYHHLHIICILKNDNILEVRSSMDNQLSYFRIRSDSVHKGTSIPVLLAFPRSHPNKIKIEKPPSSQLCLASLFPCFPEMDFLLE